MLRRDDQWRVMIIERLVPSDELSFPPYYLHIPSQMARPSQPDPQSLMLSLLSRRDRHGVLRIIDPA